MIKIHFRTFLDGHHQEKLEDDLKKFLQKQKIECRIENTKTGNEMTVNSQDFRG